MLMYGMQYLFGEKKLVQVHLQARAVDPLRSRNHGAAKRIAETRRCLLDAPQVAQCSTTKTCPLGQGSS